MDDAARRYLLSVKVVQKWKAFAKEPLDTLRAKQHARATLLRRAILIFGRFLEVRRSSRALLVSAEAWQRRRGLASALQVLEANLRCRSAAEENLVKALRFWAARRVRSAVELWCARLVPAACGGGGASPDAASRLDACRAGRALRLFRRDRLSAAVRVARVRAFARALAALRRAIAAKAAWATRAARLASSADAVRGRRRDRLARRTWDAWLAARPEPAPPRAILDGESDDDGAEAVDAAALSRALHRLRSWALLRGRDRARLVTADVWARQSACSRAVVRLRSSALRRSKHRVATEASVAAADVWCDVARARRFLVHWAAAAAGRKASRLAIGMGRAHWRRRALGGALLTWRQAHFGNAVVVGARDYGGVVVVRRGAHLRVLAAAFRRASLLARTFGAWR